MIAFLEGKLAAKTPQGAIVNVGGLGFELGMSQSSLSQLPDLGEPLSLRTFLQVRDDGMALFGFTTIEEKALFERLITVSGVGPKVALAALSTYSPGQLAKVIAEQDVAAVQRVPGIGKKTASRIILELKGSLGEDMERLFDKGPDEGSAAVEGAKEALLSMGFTAAEIDLALSGAAEGSSEKALLQYALKRLA